MRENLLDYLACPRCKSGLTLHAEESQREEILRGTVDCEAGCGSYPIREGVPQLLPELCGQAGAKFDEQARTRGSFSAQWRMFAYGGTTWGFRVDERIPVACYELQWRPEDLPGKVLLDAGCGNGTLSRAFADLGAEVIAADLSESIFRARKHCHCERLHFVQANLFFPPFKKGVLDAIYSCGVFHHTPDTRRCFDALVPALKGGDSRYFVWLYARRSALFNATVEQFMKITRRTPEWLLVPLCMTLAPFVEYMSRFLRLLGVVDHARRTLRDRAIQLHDLLAPAYVWYHSYEEAREWARDAGLQDVTRTDYNPNGQIDAYTRALLDKYRTVCRPGFGILCSRGSAQPSPPT